MPQKKNKREQELEQQVAELTADLKRIQADFMNYRRRVEEDRQDLTDVAKGAVVMKLLPVIDTIELAIAHTPADLQDNAWVQGVTRLDKTLEKSLLDLGITRIPAVGQPFDPNLHEAISAEGEGDTEVISEELRAGWRMGGNVIRHSLVKITRE